ncbi:Potassium voltage-gated channel subfamily KQT member 1 [Porphyridium purpureum]|uniref:Potassium voltage-gated channel subfamily KQT member 1 n=1 Tax=Porphyridium purpureum TaxID=35688 RepID=A0A5J4Z1M3_PORPP|nr:Potassium voltage-gated channel subfamily KQT member 1 [Porphyridium purpureum]|eukprot:POR3225..scf208_2
MEGSGGAADGSAAPLLQQPFQHLRRRPGGGQGSVISDSRRTKARRQDVGVQNRQFTRRGTTVLQMITGDAPKGKRAKEGVEVEKKEKGHGIDHTSRHSWLYLTLSSRSVTPAAKVYRIFVLVLILLCGLAYIFSTSEEFLQRYHPVLFVFEAFSSTIFLVEYIARMVVITEKTKYEHPLWGRLRYAIEFRAIVDLISCLPFFIERLFPLSLPTLTGVRIFRLSRIFRTDGWAHSFGAVHRVLFFHRHILFMSLMLCVMLVVSTGFLLHIFRPPQGDDEQFASMLATMYLSTLMLTGQGGPEGEGFPAYTKVVIIITATFSVAIFAVPSSMLIFGFEAEAERQVIKDHKRRLKLAKNGGVASESSLSGYSTSTDCDGNSTSSSSSDSWADYEAVIVGGDDEAGSVDLELQERRIAEMSENFFAKLDVDGSGTVSKDEVVQLLRTLIQDNGMSGMVKSLRNNPATDDISGALQQISRDIAALKDQMQAIESKLAQ